jgi:hypothetical protein
MPRNLRCVNNGFVAGMSQAEDRQSDQKRLNPALHGERVESRTNAGSACHQAGEPPDGARQIEPADARFPRTLLLPLDDQQDRDRRVGDPEEAEKRVEENETSKGRGKREPHVRDSDHQTTRDHECLPAVGRIRQPPPQKAPEHGSSAGQSSEDPELTRPLTEDSVYLQRNQHRRRPHHKIREKERSVPWLDGLPNHGHVGRPPETCGSRKRCAADPLVHRGDQRQVGMSVRLPHQQKGDGRRVGDLSRDASHQRSFEPAPSVRSHDDKARAELAGHLGDDLSRMTLLEVCLYVRHAEIAELPRRLVHDGPTLLLDLVGDDIVKDVVVPGASVVRLRSE